MEEDSWIWNTPELQPPVATPNCRRSVPEAGAGQGWATPWAGIDCLFGLRGRCDSGRRGSPGPMGCGVCGWPRVPSESGRLLAREGVLGWYSVQSWVFSVLKTVKSSRPSVAPTLVLLLSPPLREVQPRWPACCSSALQAHACLQVFDLPVPCLNLASALYLSVTSRHSLTGTTLSPHTLYLTVVLCQRSPVLNLFIRAQLICLPLEGGPHRQEFSHVLSLNPHRVGGD